MPLINAAVQKELLRIRDRLHKLEGRVAVDEMQTKLLIETMARVERKVDEMSTADEIAEAVARHDASRNHLILSPGQRYAFLAGLGIVIANILLRIFGVAAV